MIGVSISRDFIFVSAAIAAGEDGSVRECDATQARACAPAACTSAVGLPDRAAQLRASAIQE